MKLIEKITFTNQFFIQQKITFTNQLAVLLGEHCSGKTTILKTLADGLCGKPSANVLVNDQKVTASDFQILYLKDNFDLHEEIKITKKSPFRYQIFKTINKKLMSQEKYAAVTNDLKKLALSIETVITDLFSDNLKALTNDSIVLKFDVNKINIEGIIDELLEVHLFDQKSANVIDDKTFNRFLIRMVIFNVLKAALDENDIQRPVIVLFDNPELYTTLKTTYQLNQILKSLMKKANFYLLLASNSPDYLIDLECKMENINWLKADKVFHFIDPNKTLQEGVATHAFLTNPDYQNWSQYQVNFNDVFDLQDTKKEWINFYRQVFIYLIKGFFVDQIILDVSDYPFFNLQTLATKKNIVGFCHLPFKDLMVLAVFLFYFNLSFQFTDSFKKQNPKINDFFGTKE